MKSNVVLLALLALLVFGAGCHKNNGNSVPPAVPGNFRQTNIVADVADFGAARLDTKLLNAWGIAVNPGGIVWIAANHSGTSTVYDSTGKTLLGPVAIPFKESHFGGSPTGIVFNPGADFVIPATQKAAKFIFVNENGTVSAWSGGDSTLTVADRSAADAVYKGLALVIKDNYSYLYAANFKGGTIDVFDKTFTYIGNGAFKDPSLPAGFGPFNIQYIGGMLYVTYAKLKGPDDDDDQAGPGNGYVDVFNTDGTLVRRFASQGALNSPWGLAQAPAGSGLPLHAILIGNFGDGRINVYDSTGVFKGPLQNNGNTVVIEGLWALDFPYNEAPMSDPRKLYFTAGPMDENHGLFGAIRMQ